MASNHKLVDVGCGRCCWLCCCCGSSWFLFFKSASTKTLMHCFEYIASTNASTKTLTRFMGYFLTKDRTVSNHPFSQSSLSSNATLVPVCFYPVDAILWRSGSLMTCTMIVRFSSEVESIIPPPMLRFLSSIISVCVSTNRRRTSLWRWVSFVCKIIEAPPQLIN